jgi:hypothetical protein
MTLICSLSERTITPAKTIVSEDTVVESHTAFEQATSSIRPSDWLLPVLSTVESWVYHSFTRFPALREKARRQRR